MEHLQIYGQSKASFLSGVVGACVAAQQGAWWCCGRHVVGATPRVWRCKASGPVQDGGRAMNFVSGMLCWRKNCGTWSPETIYPETPSPLD